MQYNANAITRFFNQWGDKETGRLELTPEDEISLHIHNYFIDKFLPRNSKVLEIGAGPGRFTKKLAQYSTSNVITDISKVQLDLNRHYAQQNGYEDKILEWKQVDLVDLSEFTDCSFDALVAYGGPLSYTLDKRQQALNEIHRVLQPGGLVLLSVMSLFGTMHKYLDGVFQYSTETNDKIISTGDLTEENINNRNGHYMHLFQSDELKTLLIKSGFHSISMSASNFISVGWNEELQNIRNSEHKWNAIKRWEAQACASPGALDAGTHIIVAAYKS